ncbi:MAG: amidophosphoribosyltransferase [Spirochaetaceae bacterium]|jgi:amidophosphoribosyltransferase|nr:amidophosphoribosyltransferase [Spirochaetaceae bacterium]
MIHGAEERGAGIRDANIREECGLFGVYAGRNAVVSENLAYICYTGLCAVQHRGQESAGIALNSGGVITARHGLGLIAEAFTPEKIKSLGDGGAGGIALGHVRYATTGNKRLYNAQPLVVKHIKGSLALGHNGNVINAIALRRELELKGSIFHSSSDTEVIVHAIVRERLSADSIEQAVEAVFPKLEGAFSLLLMSRRKLIACRDPNGFRPLCMGKLGESVVFASESCALSAAGAEFVRDIAPGEIVVVSDEGVKSVTTHCGRKSSLCVFEYVYFARPDSVIDGLSVHEARLRAGEILATEHPADADVVIGVPDSGLDAALGYSRAIGIPYDAGLIKSKYVGRTFINPDQQLREAAVRIKLNPIASVVNGKSVVIVDDSIVRGTTSRKIIKLLRRAGARKVHVRLSCPPFRHPCYFGTDIDTRENLIAHLHELYEICDIIDADTLGFLSIDALSAITAGCASGLCDACFSGVYPVDVSGAQLKSQFEQDIDAD